MAERAAPRALELAVIGMSATPTSGMRDHALLLADALSERGTACSIDWLARTRSSLPGAHSEIAAWARGLGDRLSASRPDAVLMHYASFAYSYRGVPLFLREVLAALKRAEVPLLTIMHELVYPWRAGELRANVWASSQRVALLGLMRASAAVVVTTDYRAHWLSTRRWLPRRTLAVAPVFSNLPPPRAGASADSHGRLGLFGFAYEGVQVELVLDAIRLLHARGVQARLVLLGSPGADSEPGRRWLAAADTRGLAQLVSFSGMLPAQEISDAIAGCDVLLCVAAVGPTSSRGTLAASLASGRPVVALDGPRAWAQLSEGGAARVVEPTPEALARALEELLADEVAREDLGARGRALYEERMAVGRSAELVLALARRVLEPPA